LLNQIGPSAGRTFGPFLAGILITVRNAATAFFGLTTVYVVAAVVTMRLPASRAGAAAPASAIQQIADGLRYIRRTPVLFWLLFLLTFATLFILMLYVIVPAIAVEVLDTSAVQFGWMWGALAIGSVMTAMLLAVLGGFRRNGAAMVAAMLIYTPCLVLFGLTHTYWLALVYLFGMGIAFPLWLAATATILQNFAAPEYRGRVMAVYAMAQQGIAVSWLLGGWLLDTIGIFPTVLVAVGGGWTVLMTAMIASKELRSS
jgi:MFS family permease